MRAPGNRLRIAGALTSGLLFALAFPGPDLGWLAWVAFVPLLLATRDLSPAYSFRYGFLTGLLGFGLLLEWIRIFGLPAWGLLTAGLALYLGGFAAGTSFLVRGRPWALLWAAPLTWVAVEVVRSVGPLGFPWGLLGLTQYRTPAVLGLASVAGVYGISGLIALVNAAVASALWHRRIDRGSSAAAAAVALVVAAALASGAVSAGAVREAVLRAELRSVAVVQPNVPPRQRGDPLIAAQLVAGLLRQTGEARAAGAEIIVYPETAVPGDLGEIPELRAAIARSAAGAPVVVGASLRGPRNGAVVLDSQGEVLGTYIKHRLVPFGEAGVVPGVDARPVRTPAGTIGLVICYESAFPFMVRSLVKGGADLITVLTNDGWFGQGAGPPQHAAHAVVRAVETGRSVARAANTGSSMLIGPDGTVLRSLPLDTAGVLVASLPVGGPATPYVLWGWLVAPLAAAVWVLAAAPIGVAALRRRPAAAWKLVAALTVPAAPWMLGRLLAPDDLPGPLVALGVLLAAMLVGRGRLLNRRGIWASAAASLGGTGLVVWAMRAAYSQYGFQVPGGVPGGGGLVAILGYALGGIAIEAWLRGAVFAAAQELGGWVFAVAVSTVMGVGLYLGLARVPQEILFWYLITGAGYGLLRVRTGDAVGLGPARGLGDAAILALSGLR